MCSILKLHSFWERERECGARLATPCELARLGSSCNPPETTTNFGLGAWAAPPVKHDALLGLWLLPLSRNNYNYRIQNLF